MAIADNHCYLMQADNDLFYGISAPIGIQLIDLGLEFQ
jgi:hypothetical protein